MKTIRSNLVNTKAKTDTDISNILKLQGRTFLLKLKQRSMRVKNSWFRVLSLDKRRYIDAVIQTVERIHSPRILAILLPLTEKLLQAIGGARGLLGDLSYGMQTFGQSQAQKIGKMAHDWGYSVAAKWANDVGFVRYLTVIDMNDLPMFKVSSKL